MHCRGVAKLVKALDFDSSMRRFESFFPCHNKLKALIASAVKAFLVSEYIQPNSLSAVRWQKKDSNPERIHFGAKGRVL